MRQNPISYRIARLFQGMASAFNRAAAAPVYYQAIHVFLIALAVRIALILLQGSSHDQLRAEMERTAISLADQGVLGNAYAVPTGPSAHVNPIYALILAAIFKVFGTGSLGEFMKVLFSSSVSSLQYALLPALASGLSMPRTIGLAAGLVGALIPLKPYVEIQGDFQEALTALMLLVALQWTASLWHRGWKRREPVAYGAYHGLVALTSASLLPVSLVLLGLLAFRFRSDGMRQFRPVAAALAVMVLTLSPWAIRNLMLLDAPIFTRSNFGLEFHLANNGAAGPLMTKNIKRGLYQQSHPMRNTDEAMQVRDMGEVAYNEARQEEAMAWIRAHPRRFVKLTLKRIWFTWFPQTSPQYREMALWGMTLAASVGLLFLFRNRKDAAILLGVVLLVFPLPYYFFQVHVRYRYPIDFVLLLSAMAGLYAAWYWASSRGRKAEPATVAVGAASD